ncbi:MAG: AAA family ATPase [Deltaproteobacteria bacterium]|nr:AAA family ATPase [Deltaproteobacteria bacterium]MBN2670401.1 AAA family ATPase [Deltaproteobacteria bacterium]
MNFTQELALNLQSDYPIVFVVTFEEQTVMHEIEEACAQAGLHAQFPRKPGTLVDLDQQLRALESGKVVVLNDVHLKLSEPDVVRLLSDLDVGLSGAVVVVTPSPKIPRELERISSVVEYPLPDISRLTEVLRTTCVETGVILVDDDAAAMVRVAQGLTQGEAKRAFKKALLGWPEEAALARAAVEKEKRKALVRSNVLEHVEVTEDFSNVGGMNMLKSWLRSRKQAFSEEARRFGLPVPKGLLLMGIQGCGKSLAAKAVAGFWGLPLVRLDISAVFGQASPEESLRVALRTAEAMAPVILWIDEIEKGFDNQFKGAQARLLGGLITWLQEKQKEVFVVATANKVDALPPELPRKGRFDEIFFVDLPDIQERKDILTLHLQKRGLNPDAFNLDDLARKTEKLTGSELEQLVIGAMYLAFERGEQPSADDLRKVFNSTVSLYDTFESEIKKMREWARKRARMASSDRSKLDYFK